MAKATSKDQGSLARTGGSASETPSGEEMAEGMENDDMELGTDEVVETPAASTASAVALSGEGSIARSGAQAPARRGPPEALMRNPVTRFLVESYLELLKVTWPRPDEAWQMTLVVIAMSAFVAIVLGAADLGLQKALSILVSLSGK